MAEYCEKSIEDGGGKITKSCLTEMERVSYSSKFYAIDFIEPYGDKDKFTRWYYKTLRAAVEGAQERLLFNPFERAIICRRIKTNGIWFTEVKKVIDGKNLPVSVS